MLDNYIIITGVLLLSAMVLAGIATYSYFFIADKTVFADIEKYLKKRLSGIKFLGSVSKYVYYFLAGILLLINWLCWTGIVFFGFGSLYINLYITGFCFILIFLSPNVIARILKQQQDSPGYQVKFTIIYTIFVALLAVISFFDFNNSFSALDSKTKEKQFKPYKACTKEAFGVYHNAINPYKSLDNCNNIEKNLKAMKKLKEQHYNCKALCPDHLAVKFLDYTEHLYLVKKEFDLTELKRENKCDISEEK